MSREFSPYHKSWFHSQRRQDSRANTLNRSQSSAYIPRQPSQLSKNISFKLLHKAEQMGPIIDQLILKTESKPQRTNRSIEKIINIVQRADDQIHKLSTQNKAERMKYNQLKLNTDREITNLKKQLQIRLAHQPNNISQAFGQIRHALHNHFNQVSNHAENQNQEVSELRLELDKVRELNIELSARIIYLEQTLEMKIRNIQELSQRRNTQIDSHLVQTLKYTRKQSQEPSESVPTSRSDYEVISLLRLEKQELMRKNRELREELELAVLGCKEATKGIKLLEYQNEQKERLIDELESRLQMDYEEEVKLLYQDNQRLNSQICMYQTELQNLKSSISKALNKTYDHRGYKPNDSSSINFQLSLDTPIAEYPPSYQPELIASRLNTIESLHESSSMRRDEKQLDRNVNAFSFDGNSNRPHDPTKIDIPPLEFHSGSSQFNKIKRVMNKH